MPTDNIQIAEVSSKSALRKFIKFPFSIYKDNPNWVPPLISDELRTFDHKQNPAFDYCTSRYWMATINDKIVGRIAGIIHQPEAEEAKLGRFGWIDFIDNYEVSELLLKTVRKWFEEEGLKGMHGPLGFTDMDFEGLLTEGFDSISTIATIYNAPYYADHLKNFGFDQEVDWIEMEGKVPEEIPAHYEERNKLIKKRFGFREVKVKNSKQLLPYGRSMFEALNQAYKELYGFYELTDKEIKYYIDQYFTYINKDYVSLILDKNNEVAGFGVTTPSMSLAFQKAKGRLFPFGFIHILKALKYNDTAEMFLIGVRPKYHKFGVTKLIFHDVLKGLKKTGIKKFYTNPIISTNSEAIDQWKGKGLQGISKVRKKRSCFKLIFDQ